MMGLMMVLVAVPVWGQESSAPAETVGGKRQAMAAKNAETLGNLFDAMTEVQGLIEDKRSEWEEVTVEEQRRELEVEVEGLKARLSGLVTDFEKLATGVDKTEFDDAGSEVIDLNEEFRALLRPVVGELKAATSKPRELEEMRSMVEMLTQRKALANRAVARLMPLRELSEGSELGEELGGLQAEWERRLLESDSQMQALTLRIEERTAERGSMWSLVSETVARFCTTRGRNMLMALLAFMGTLIVSRGLFRLLERYGPLHRKRQSSFLVRIIDVSFGVISIVLSAIVAFGVLYATGDWVMLTIGIFFLLGVAWAAKNTLPAVYEQLKLVLNLGPVREGERIVFGGIPWRVDELGFYCEFTNPELTGGLLRLPLRNLIDEHSRPFHEKEHWFPTSANDWVLLGDGTYGKVVSQTPEQVVVLKLGGSRATYPTASFLELNPENLSGNFRVRVTFGIDYAHQADVTTSIPEIFRERIEADLAEYAGEDGLVSLKVEFKEAGASSLDLAVLADMSGKMGSRYQFLQRRIQRVCVDVCNEKGYGIPFTQITVHQAD